jgi:hypothetical protein
MWLKIEHDLSTDFKVTWGDKSGHVVLSYSVGRSTVLDAAATVRKELGELHELADMADPAEKRRRLIRLAEAGRSLRWRLFNDPAKEREIAALEDWISDEFKADDDDLFVHADFSIHVPWGLIYDGEAPRMDGTWQAGDSAAEIRDFSGFWSLKYQLSTTPNGQRVRSRSKLTRGRKTFGLLSLVNSEVHEQIKQDLGADYDAFEKILNPPLGVAHDFTHCNDLLNETQQVDILFHFLGHQHGQVLYLSDGNTISYDDYCRLIRLLVRSRNPETSPYSLLFLNGCETAIGDDDLTFRREALREQICGAIATESVVRTKYAAIFGYRFLRAMVNEGKSVAEAMNELRHDPAMWPESLLYGCYAQPDYRIEAKPAESAVA